MCKGGLDISKDILCVCVGQMAAKLQAVKVEKNSAAQPESNLCRRGISFFSATVYMHR